MYEFVRGALVKAFPPLVIVDVGGVGYRLHAPLSLFGKLPNQGTCILLYTSYVVRETGHQLFGFGSLEERDLFDQLTGVSGIGPKLALSLVGHLTPANLQRAVAQGDWTTLATTPGIGRKTAERLIVELRGRLVLTDPEGETTPVLGDAVAALVNLGYTQQVARSAVDRVWKTAPQQEIGQLIMAALKVI